MQLCCWDSGAVVATSFGEQLQKVSGHCLTAWYEKVVVGWVGLGVESWRSFNINPLILSNKEITITTSY